MLIFIVYRFFWPHCKYIYMAWMNTEMLLKLCSSHRGIKAEVENQFGETDHYTQSILLFAVFFFILFVFYIVKTQGGSLILQNEYLDPSTCVKEENSGLVKIRQFIAF